MIRCGLFPDPAQVPEELDLGPELPSCGRERWHPLPHRAELPGTGSLPLVLEWTDPQQFLDVMRGLESEFGREAIRMWVERAPEAGDLRISTQTEWMRAAPGWGPMPVIAATYGVAGQPVRGRWERAWLCTCELLRPVGEMFQRCMSRGRRDP